MNYICKPAILFAALFCINAGYTVYAQNSEVTLNKAEKNVLMMASYMGLAHYCWAYGPDWRPLSDRFDKNIRRKIEGDARAYILWSHGYKAGGNGNLFSIKADNFIDISVADNIRNVCKTAYGQSLKISRMK